MPAPLLTRVRTSAFKVEATPYTAEVLGDGDGGLNVYDAAMKAVIPPTTREGQGSLTMLAPVPGARAGEYTFKTDLYNAASMPAWFNLLLAAGMTANTGMTSFSFLTGSTTTLTAGLWQDASRLLSIYGAKADLTITGEYGKPVVVEVKMSGVWAPPSTTAVIAPTRPSTQPPRFAGVTLTVGGSHYRLSKMVLSFGNVLSLLEDVEAVDSNTEGTGYAGCAIAGRNPVLKIDPQALGLGTQDWYNVHRNATSLAFSCAIGTGSNKVTTIAAGALQLLNPPDPGDRGGKLVENLEFACTSTTPDGELTITRS